MSTLREITRKTAKPFLAKYHYLNKQGSGFRTGINFGLFEEDGGLIGVCIYHTPSVNQTKKGMLSPHHQDKIVLEMGRLCIHPDTHKKNLLSNFVSKTFKYLKKHHKNVDYILTYADNQIHTGKIYQALSMPYYGLTTKKRDFFFLREDGSYRKHQRGKIRGHRGEWRNRSQKHRYVKVLKKNLAQHILWTEENHKNIEFKKQQFNFHGL